MASLSTPLHRFLPRQGLRLMTMCSHIPGNGDIYDDVHTSLNLISNQFPARSLGSRLAVIGHDWVPYSWSNSKLIFLILNNEKPWAPWRRKTEKLIDQLSLSFFKAAPHVQTRAEQKGIMATMRWYLISWHYPHYVRITQTSPDQTQIWEIRGSCPGHVTTGCKLPRYHQLSQSFLQLFYPRLESIYLFCSGSETINWRARVDIAKWFSGSQISSETGSSRRMEPNEIETS